MRRLLLLALFLVIALPAAYASVSLAYSVKDLTLSSELVLRGTVQKTTSKWVGKRIVTEVTLKVDNALIGAPGSEVTLYTPGGVVEGIGMKVSGAATFTPKEEVLVFLMSNKSQYEVLGLAQGKYRISVDASGKKIATPDLDGLSLVKKLPDGKLAPVAAPRPAALSALEAEIKSYRSK